MSPGPVACCALTCDADGTYVEGIDGDWRAGYCEDFGNFLGYVRPGESPDRSGEDAAQKVGSAQPPTGIA